MRSSLQVILISLVGILFFMLIVVILKRKTLDKLSKNNKIFFKVLLGLILLITCILIYDIYLYNWHITSIFILNLLILFINIISIVLAFHQYYFNKQIINKNCLLENYLDTSKELIEKYSLTIHKYKNNLIALKGYLQKNTKEANNYINNLLEDYETKKYKWVKEINHIPDKTISCLIFYKLSKAENNKLKLSISISKDIQNIEINIFQGTFNVFLEILGEYFDNAISASKHSKEKELSFTLYKEKKDLIFKIANTYKDKININVIDKKGYTTKGYGHGLGLYDISKKIKNISELNNKYELIDNYFVVTLKLKT